MKEDSMAGPANLITPVVRAMRLLRYIAQGGNTSNLSEVGRVIDVNRVTVMRLLATLEAEGFIERLDQGGHQIAISFLTMAASALGTQDMIRAGRRIASELSRTFGASAYLVVPDGLDIVYVVREMPETGLVSHIRLGSRVAAYLTAPGRAMLATLSDDELIRRMGTQPLERPTQTSPASLADLKRLLAADRERGCAWSFSGYEAGINACAAAVIDGDGKAVAALSVVGPEHLFAHNTSLHERIETTIKLAASDLSLIISADGHQRPGMT